MPIRMTDDPQEDQPSYEGDGDGGGRGGGGFPQWRWWLINLLPLVFGLFRSKLGIAVLIIGGIAYFMFGRGGCNMPGGGVADNISKLATVVSWIRNNLKKQAFTSHCQTIIQKILCPKAPTCKNLHLLWATRDNKAVALHGAALMQQDPYWNLHAPDNPGDNVKFSPSFLYNQIGLDGCQGSYIERAMEFMTKQGSVPYNAFPYNDQNCTNQPDQQLVQQASQYKMRGF